MIPELTPILEPTPILIPEVAPESESSPESELARKSLHSTQTSIHMEVLKSNWILEPILIVEATLIPKPISILLHKPTPILESNTIPEPIPETHYSESIPHKFGSSWNRFRLQFNYSHH